MVNPIAAEFRKVLSLPSALGAFWISVAAALGITALNASSTRTMLDTGSLTSSSAMEVGLGSAPISSIAAIVLGVVIISSEYAAISKDVGGGRQILTSLIGTPRRGVLLTAKATVLTIVTAVLATVTIAASIALAEGLLGRHGHSPGEVVDALGLRTAGAVAYCVLTALIAFAVTTLTRSGIVPMILLIVNSSVVSFSFLLTKVTPLARYLPDVAGAQMFAIDYAAENMLDPLPGGLVMTSWTAGLLVIAAFAFVRRDA